MGGRRIPTNATELKLPSKLADRHMKGRDIQPLERKQLLFEMTKHWIWKPGVQAASCSELLSAPAGRSYRHLKEILHLGTK
jgi:hypothetical protein